MKRKEKSLLIVAAVAVAAGGAFVAARRGPKATPVEIATVGREDLQAKVTANGKVQAQKKVDISATIPGQITHLAVEEGDRVSKGQFLLQIDAVNPRAAARSTEFSMQALLQELESARANLEQARADLRRAEENFAAGIIPEAELQRARTAVATAEAARPGRRAPGRAGPRHARRAPATRWPRPRSARPSTASSPPSASRRARSR